MISERDEASLSLPTPYPQSFQSIISVMQSLGRGFILTDNEGKICYSSEKFCEIVGYDPREIQGGNPRMFQSGNTSSNTYKTMWNTVSSGRPWNGILENRRKNRQRFLEDITITPIVDVRGAITHFMGEVREIDPDNVNRSRSPSVDDMDHALQIADGVALEVNNVLSGIIGHCSLAKHRGETEGPAMRRVEIIHSLANRLASFSKKISICTGRRLSRSMTIDLNTLVFDTLDDLESERDLSTVMTSASDRPIFVPGNAELLATAIRELTLNALESQKPQTPEILVEVAVGEWNGENASEGKLSFDFGLPLGKAAILSIRDQGVGMEPELLKLSIDLFYSTKMVHPGLGLPAVLGIARSHGGAFEIQSSVRRGTIIKLYLPLKRDL